MAFVLGNAGHTAISVETSSSYMRHLLLHLVCSKKKNSQIQLKLPAVALPPYSPFPLWDLKGIYAFTGKQVFFPYHNLLFYFYTLINISKTKTKPTLQAVLEIGLMQEPQGEGSTFQHGVTMNRSAGIDQLDDGERRNAGRQDKMWSKAVHLATSLEGTRQKQELNVFCAYLYKHMYFR